MNLSSPTHLQLRGALAPWLPTIGDETISVLAERWDRIVLRLESSNSNFVVTCNLNHEKAQREFAAQKQLASSGLASELLSPLIHIGAWSCFGSVFLKGENLVSPRKAHLASLAQALARLYEVESLSGLDLPPRDPVQMLHQWCGGLLSQGASDLANQGAQLADAIEDFGVCFDEGFVHGDMTPSNIITGAAGVVFIDFEHCGRGDAFFDFSKLFVSREWASMAEMLAEAVFGERLVPSWPRLLDLYVQSHRFGIEAWRIRHRHNIR